MTAEEGKVGDEGKVAEEGEVAENADRPEGIELSGGIANHGLVTRHGEVVRRPASPHGRAINAMLVAVRERGFFGASLPLPSARDGREQFEFIEGDVATPPYPTWARSDDALTSTARLIREFHDATTEFVTEALGETWSREMADPSIDAAAPSDAATSDAAASAVTPAAISGLVICHNDVCLENVVFRDGQAVGLIDFDFAAPGRRSFDVAAFARMCVPIDDHENAERLGWEPADKPARLRAVVDAYGLDVADRSAVLTSLDRVIDDRGSFVRRRVEAGEPAFIEMWRAMGGDARFDRRHAWWQRERDRFVHALR